MSTYIKENYNCYGRIKKVLIVLLLYKDRARAYIEQ